jgi:hypothetical protein
MNGNSSDPGTMMAYCGLSCGTCPIHLATLEQDVSRQSAMRESIAEKCSTLYGMNLLPEDITDCDGCRSATGRIFVECLNCKIRNCARQKNLDHCAACKDYPCEILEKHFSLDPGSRDRLDEI